MEPDWNGYTWSLMTSTLIGDKLGQIMETSAKPPNEYDENSLH